MKNNVLTYICLNTFYIYIFKYPDCVGHLFICLGPILECDFKSSFISLRWIYSSLELSAMNNFKIRDGTLGLLSLLNSMFHLVWAWEGIVHVISHIVHTYSCYILGIPNKLCPWSNSPFCVFFPFCAFFHYTSLICKVCDMGTRFRPEYFKSFYSLYIFLWLFSVILWLLIDFTVVAVVILVWFFLKSMFIFN